MIKNDIATKRDIKELEKNIKSEMTDLKVELLGELKKMQENDAVHQFSHMRINEDIIDLQGRVSKIEKPNLT
ncbi:MAG TPA: hypothetical protein VI819_00715 [Patescibacteria group bacterium]|nr:hypothetical protein [Patescibacteria group bacterium]